MGLNTEVLGSTGMWTSLAVAFVFIVIVVSAIYFIKTGKDWK